MAKQTDLRLLQLSSGNGDDDEPSAIPSDADLVEMAVYARLIGVPRGNILDRHVTLAHRRPTDLIARRSETV